MARFLAALAVVATGLVPQALGAQMPDPIDGVEVDADAGTLMGSRENGVQVFYNQLIAAYMGWKGVRENPSVAITFGDGSAIPKQGLEKIVELSKEFTFDLAWQDGDVALVDNEMAMHGRRPFTGERKRQVLVALTAANA